jgi:hypothetical protein
VRCLTLVAILVLAGMPEPLRAESREPDASGESGIGGYVAADSSAPPVTAANLMQNERFWPYHVELVSPWRPLSREKPLPTGAGGVLIRVEPGDVARIDFGRDGIYDVPIGQTDLVDAANRIRRGEKHKMAPNAALAIGRKLTDSRADRLVVFKPEEAVEMRGFLCVFADPDAEGFAELAAALAPLQERAGAGVLTVLFPQGQHPDQKVLERLRELDWKVPFAFDFLSESYTDSFLPAGTPLPAVLLQTAEGRLVFMGAWQPDTFPKLTAAFDAEFGPATSATAATASPAGD